MSKTQELIVEAYNKGYRIIDGDCINPKGKILKGTIKHHPVPYKQMSVKTSKGSRSIFYHALLAYQLYGNLYFVKGTVARHRDGNSLNNSPENIILGTMKDNILDIPSKRRTEKGIKSNKTKNKLSEGMLTDIINDYNLGMTPKQLYIKYDTCLNTIYIIIRKLNSIFPQSRF
jgi:hypothetical protein